MVLGGYFDEKKLIFLRKRLILRRFINGVLPYSIPATFLVDEGYAFLGPSITPVDDGRELYSPDGLSWEIWVFDNGELIVSHPALPDDILGIPEPTPGWTPPTSDPSEPVGEDPESEAGVQPSGEPPSAMEGDDDDDNSSSDDTGDDDPETSSDPVDQSGEPSSASQPNSDEDQESSDDDYNQGDIITVSGTAPDGTYYEDVYYAEDMTEEEQTEVISDGLDAGASVEFTDGETGEVTSYGDGLPDDY